MAARSKPVYEVMLKPRAEKDLARLPGKDTNRILDALEKLRGGLSGDVKHLTNFTPEYRLRVGQYRVLFEAEEHTITVYRILSRKDAYR